MRHDIACAFMNLLFGMKGREVSMRLVTTTELMQDPTQVRGMLLEFRGQPHWWGLIEDATVVGNRTLMVDLAWVSPDLTTPRTLDLRERSLVLHISKTKPNPAVGAGYKAREIEGHTLCRICPRGVDGQPIDYPPKQHG